MVAASRFPQHCNLLYTLGIPGPKLKDSKILDYNPSGRFSDIMSLGQNLITFAHLQLNPECVWRRILLESQQMTMTVYL